MSAIRSKAEKSYAAATPADVGTEPLVIASWKIAPSSGLLANHSNTLLPNTFLNAASPVRTP